MTRDEREALVRSVRPEEITTRVTLSANKLRAICDYILNDVQVIERQLAEARTGLQGWFEAAQRQTDKLRELEAALATARDKALEDAAQCVDGFGRPFKKISDAVRALAKSPATPTSTETNDG